jgi:hypothetical protein
MADRNPTDRDDCSVRPPRAEDERLEWVVLENVLKEHPTQLTEAEIVLARCRAEGDFAEVDAVERALKELVGAGLLRREGRSFLPTRPALVFYRLSVEFNELWGV